MCLAEREMNIVNCGQGAQRRRGLGVPAAVGGLRRGVGARPADRPGRRAAGGGHAQTFCKVAMILLELSSCGTARLANLASIAVSGCADGRGLGWLHTPRHLGERLEVHAPGHILPRLRARDQGRCSRRDVRVQRGARPGPAVEPLRSWLPLSSNGRWRWVGQHDAGVLVAADAQRSPAVGLRSERRL